jgi:tetratricopeptide (TPR) repeat protein
LSVLGNPNTMAAYLVPIVPLILYKLTMSSKWISRLLLAIWGILVLVVLILTRSRGGLLGLAAALVYYGIALARQKTRNEQPSLKWLKVGALTLAAASSLLVYGVIVRYSRGVSLQDVPIQVRLETMAGALKILAAYPLLGSGPGTFGQELLRYQHPLREIHAHAHNLFLTFASETGWAGILCMVWLVGVTLRQWRPTDRETSALSQGSVRVALQAAWLGLVVHNLADSFFEIPAVILLMATLFGLWVGLVFQPRPLPRLWGRIVNLIASIVLVMTTAFGLRVTQGLAAYGRAAHATATGDWVAAAEHLKEAIKWSPQSRFYHRQLGFVHGYLALRLRSGQAAENPVYRSQAITQYKETLQVMDQFALDHANLSCLLWENGDPTQAIQEMTRARDLDPDNGLYRLNLGQYLEAQGNYNQAWDEYAWFLSHRPRHLHSSYWQQASPRKEHLPTILERAIEETITTEGADSLNLARLYTYAGYFSDALRVYDQWQGTNDDSTDAHIGRAEVWLAMGKLDQALTELEMAIALNPQAALAYHYRGSVYLRQNQLSEAAGNTEVALYLAPTLASYYQSGQIAQAQGDIQTARQRYEAAIAQATSPYYTRYAVEVAKRPPFAEERLPCLVIPRITDELVLPTLAEGNLLESEGHFAEAAQVYRRLLSYEPNEPRVKDRLERLCRQHQTSCQE